MKAFVQFRLHRQVPHIGYVELWAQADVYLRRIGGRWEATSVEVTSTRIENGAVVRHLLTSADWRALGAEASRVAERQHNKTEVAS